MAHLSDSATHFRPNQSLRAIAPSRALNRLVCRPRRSRLLPMTGPTREPLRGPFVWRGADLARDQDWCRPWTSGELTEIDRALAAAVRRGLTWQEITRDDFALESVADALAQVARELEDGRGVIKLTGLPVERYGEDELRLLWMGLGRHLGTPVFQDSRGQMMRDIRDEGGDLGARHGRLTNSADGSEFLSSKARTYSNGQLRYHTDRTDVVGLLTVRQAKSGGFSKIASTAAIHNAMLARRPDLLELLYQPIHRSRLGEEPDGAERTYALPVFGLRDGKLTSHYSRTYVEAAQLMPGVPRMTDLQWAALDLLAELAEELCFEMRLAPGDIQLLNNHVAYHARTPFVDDPASGQQRLLYRLWLCMPNSRPLPEDHAVLWHKVEAGSLRGGIGQAAAAPPT